MIVNTVCSVATRHAVYKYSAQKTKLKRSQIWSIEHKSKSPAWLGTQRSKCSHQLRLGLLHAEHQLPGCLGNVVGAVDDVPCVEGQVGVARLLALAVQPLRRQRDLAQADLHLMGGLFLWGGRGGKSTSRYRSLH